MGDPEEQPTVTGIRVEGSSNVVVPKESGSDEDDDAATPGMSDGWDDSSYWRGERTSYCISIEKQAYIPLGYLSKYQPTLGPHDQVTLPLRARV